MSGVNKVILIGNLTRDPEIRHGQNGMAVTSFTVACNETWTDKQTGEKKDKAEFIRVVSFRQQAETLEKYLSKGSQIFIDGKLQTRNYEKDGQTHYITEVVVSNFTFLGGGQKQAPAPQPGAYQGGQGYQPPPAGNQYQQPAPGPQYQQPAGNQYRPPPQQGHQGPPPAQQHQQPPQGPPAQPGNQYQQQAPGGYQPPPAPVYDDTSLPF